MTEPLPHEPDVRVSTIAEATDWILARAGRSGSADEHPRSERQDLCRRRRLAGMIDLARHPWMKGFTTNPTLMAKAGVRDYQAFATDVLAAIPDRPISFEVFSDEFGEMERQARTIAAWGDNVWVKIPVTNTQGESSVDADPPAVPRRHQGQRHCRHGAAAGAARGRGRSRRRAARASRSSPDASPTPVATRCRT